MQGPVRQHEVERDLGSLLACGSALSLTRLVTASQIPSPFMEVSVSAGFHEQIHPSEDIILQTCQQAPVNLTSLLLQGSEWTKVYAVHSFTRREVMLFPYRPDAPIEAAETPVPGWIWAATGVGALAFLLDFLLRSKKSEMREPVLGAAVKVPPLSKMLGIACRDLAVLMLPDSAQQPRLLQPEMISTPRL